MRARVILSALAVLLTTIVADVAPASAAAPPARDPFYKAPRGLASARPGAVLRFRQVDVTIGGAPLGDSSTAYQLLYRTNDAKNHALANVTTVIVPAMAAPPGERALVSVQDAENAADSRCAPSYQLQQGEMGEDNVNNGNLAAEMTGLGLRQLAAGRVLVVPDPEGPRHMYTARAMAAHAVLDSIRAVEHFRPAGLARGAATPVALAGYSGGALESGAANEAQPAYAPELHIVAVAAGGVPALDMDTFRYLDGSVGAGVLMGAAMGLDGAYPELRLDSLLNDAGKALKHEASTGCASSVFARPYAHFDDWTKTPNAFDLPRVRKIIDKNAFGHAAPKAPTFYYNGITDELIWIKPLDRLVANYCAHGTPISYFRDPAGAEHIQALANWAPLAHTYIDNRFAGQAPPTTCGQPLNASPAPTL